MNVGKSVSSVAPKWLPLFLVVVLAVAVSGCTYYPQQPAIGMGSSEAQVQSVLGQPHSMSTSGSKTVWHYSGGMQFVFSYGVVTSYTNYTPPPSGGYYGPAVTPVSISVVPPVPFFYGPWWPGWWGPCWGWGGYYGGSRYGWCR